MFNPARLLAAGAVAVTMLLVACGGGGDGSLVVYSGRNEELIGPLIQRFIDETGVQVEVRYGDTAAMAATILEEGENSPADVFIAQDAGALGAVEHADLLAELDDDVLERVPDAYRSQVGRWVGISGRVRVVVYNTERLRPADLPASILGFADPEWGGRLGWAPTNGSFQAFVTALRLVEGEDGARAWLAAIKANGVTDYPNNTSIVDAAAKGEIDAGFVNHYYLYRFLAEQGEGFRARNYYTAPGDVGTLVNVAGVAILDFSDAGGNAKRLVEFLLSEDAQRYFSEETYEYPVVSGVPSNLDVPELSALRPVDLDLSRLEDLDGTLDLLRSTGVLP